MRASENPGFTSLPRHVSLSLLDRAGDRIECATGVLWITQDGDQRDVVLTAGQSFRLDRSGRTVVFALADARLALHKRAQPKAGVTLERLFSAARAWLAHAPARATHSQRRSAA